MGAFHFAPCADSAQLLATIAPWTAVDPERSALFAHVAGRCDQGGWCAVVSHAGEPVLALCQTPPWPMLALGPMAASPAAAASVLAGIRRHGHPVQSVNAAADWAEAITAAAGVTTPARRLALRLHRLAGAPCLPRQVDGTARSGRPADLPLLQEWWDDFRTTIGETPGHRLTEEQVSQILLWELAGQPVAMAQAARPIFGGWTISAVYTPAPLRGRGFAGAAVHALSERLLAAGASYIVLYTDLANPISNHLYARIGFTPVLDQLRIDWVEEPVASA